MKKIKKWLFDIFSEPDNSTICPIRLLAIGGFVWALWMSGFSVLILKTPFVIVEFGTAYGVMLAALGIALGMKTDSKENKDVVLAN